MVKLPVPRGALAAKAHNATRPPRKSDGHKSALLATMLADIRGLLCFWKLANRLNALQKKRRERIEDFPCLFVLKTVLGFSQVVAHIPFTGLKNIRF